MLLCLRLIEVAVWLNCWNIRDLELPFGGMKKSGVGREELLAWLKRELFFV